MSARELDRQPEELAHFPDDRFRWLMLHDKETPYAYCAFAEYRDTLEIHVSFVRWGPRVRRCVHGDVAWLKQEARRLGKNRIMGVRIDGSGEFDPNLFRFASLYGFTDQCVLQTATLEVH